MGKLLILRALGWDTEDPKQVIPEFSTPEGRADYALVHDDKNLAMVEAKPLHSELKKARDDGFRYCWKNRVPYFVVTDGNVWELHDMKEMGGVQIFRVIMSRDNIGAIARQLLALWRPAIPEVKVAPKSVVHVTPPNGVSLPMIQKQMRPKQKPPKGLHFPDGTQKSLKRWKDLLIEVARWALPKLEQQGKLPLGKLIRRDRKNMLAPKEVGDGWWLETWFGAKGCVHNAIRILKAAGIDPNQVIVTDWEAS